MFFLVFIPYNRCHLPKFSFWMIFLFSAEVFYDFFFKVSNGGSLRSVFLKDIDKDGLIKGVLHRHTTPLQTPCLGEPTREGKPDQNDMEIMPYGYDCSVEKLT